MARKVDIPKRILRVVNRCSNGGYVVKSMPVRDAGERVSFWSFDDGKPAPELSVKEAIERGLLVPQCDGLFGRDNSQTYRAPQP